MTQGNCGETGFAITDTAPAENTHGIWAVGAWEGSEAQCRPWCPSPGDGSQTQFLLIHPLAKKPHQPIHVKDHFVTSVWSQKKL